MNQQLNGMNKNLNGMNGRLDSLEDSVEQIKSTADQSSNDSTESFLDPAHNCSHIFHDHPGLPPSGNDIHTLVFMSTLCIQRYRDEISPNFSLMSLLVTEQPWLCSEGVL